MTGKLLAVLLTALALPHGFAHAQGPSTGPSTELRAGSGQAYPIRPVRMVVGFPPGGGTVTRTPEEFAALVRADIVRYARLVKDAGLQID